MPKPKQAPLLNDPEPQTVTVNGAGLLEWSKKPNVHIYRMTTKENGIYTLSLLWLNGRKLLDSRSLPASVAEPIRTVPLRGKAKTAAIQMGLGGFA